jgi:uncharacterized membrane protein
VTRRRSSRRRCAAFFVVAGLLHFVRPKTYEQVVPPGFGDPRLVVRLSGLAEIAGGLALPSLTGRRLTRWGLVALLVAVFPANVYMALDPERSGVSVVPRWLLWARLPIQPAIIWWVWRVTRRGEDG